jgi:hypothetical protein
MCFEIDLREKLVHHSHMEEDHEAHDVLEDHEARDMLRLQLPRVATAAP